MFRNGVRLLADVPRRHPRDGKFAAGPGSSALNRRLKGGTPTSAAYLSTVDESSYRPWSVGASKERGSPRGCAGGRRLSRHWSGTATERLNAKLYVVLVGPRCSRGWALGCGMRDLARVAAQNGSSPRRASIRLSACRQSECGHKDSALSRGLHGGWLVSAKSGRACASSSSVGLRPTSPLESTR